ncbi:MAG: DNA-binding response regulator [Kangiella sp.]|nr:MAG: DNA-binding response regulator [Kangiella sp.]
MNQPHKVLIVEDDLDIADLIAINLNDAGISSHHISDGALAEQQISLGNYSLIILDIMLPNKNGLDICKSVREVNPEQAILMLTAKSSEIDQIVGLELGADDYITKPFSVASLVARVRSQLRRVELLQSRKKNKGENEITRIGKLTIDDTNHTVSINSNLIELTSTEFDLILFFGKHPDQVFSRANLLDKVWGYDHLGYEHTVNSHINRLRKKLEHFDKNNSIIQTVWGVGYKLSSESCQ